MTGTNGSNGNGVDTQIGTTRVKQGLAQMLKGGVIVSGKRIYFRPDCFVSDAMWWRREHLAAATTFRDRERIWWQYCDEQWNIEEYITFASIVRHFVSNVADRTSIVPFSLQLSASFAPCMFWFIPSVHFAPIRAWRCSFCQNWLRQTWWILLQLELYMDQVWWFLFFCWHDPSLLHPIHRILCFFILPPRYFYNRWM